MVLFGAAFTCCVLRVYRTGSKTSAKITEAEKAKTSFAFRAEKSTPEQTL
jgi:hypothetical protein